ncbi:MAG: ABC transporter ATP-binding protein [Phycisphaerae bacterium]
MSSDKDAQYVGRGDVSLLRQFFRYVKPYKRPLVGVYSLHLANGLLNLLPAFSLRYYFDMVVVPQPVSLLGFSLDSRPYMQDAGDKVFWSVIYFASLVLLIVGANTIGVVMWRMGTRVIQRLLLDIKTHIIHHLHKLSLSYFHRERTGSVMTRAVDDVMQMQRMLKNSFDLSYSSMHLIVAPLLMLSMSPVLFLFCLVPLPIIFYTVWRIRRKLRPLYRRQRQKQAEVNAAVHEQLSGIREIKAFGRQQAAQDDITRVNEDYVRAVNDAMKVFSVNHQTMHGTRDFAMVLLATGGGLLIITGTGNVTIGMILSFLPLMRSFFNPFVRLGRFYDVIQRGLASTERVFEFFEIEPDIRDKPGAKGVEITQGEVEFQDVTFGYEPDQPVLRDINLHAEPGETVALVGSTGSGKSTLVSLIPRFYDPQDGRILLDGHPLTDIKMESVRDAVGIVFQETFLFYGTIAENIGFSRQDASREEIIDAAKLANIHEFIETLPDGYDTRVGERGVTLSGGERQRVAIARMILKDPAIVILDEATSSLDTVTERLVQESMDHLMSGRTSFIIAHRLSTVRNADKILVMEHGRVIEKGTHEELISREGRYAELAVGVI